MWYIAIGPVTWNFWELINAEGLEPLYRLRKELSQLMVSNGESRPVGIVPLLVHVRNYLWFPLFFITYFQDVSCVCDIRLTSKHFFTLKVISSKSGFPTNSGWTQSWDDLGWAYYSIFWSDSLWRTFYFSDSMHLIEEFKSWGVALKSLFSTNGFDWLTAAFASLKNNLIITARSRFLFNAE